MKVKFPLCLVALLFFLSLTSACSNNEMSKLNGKWSVDRDALMEMLKSELAASVELGLDQTMVKQTVDSIADTMVMDFDTNKQEIRRKLNGQDLVLKYTVVSESSKEIKIKVDNIVSVITMTGNDSFFLQEGDINIKFPMIRVKK